MMHIFLHHFHGILLLCHKPLILHVKCTTTIVFVSVIFVLFFLRTCKQPDRQGAEGRLKCVSSWEHPMSSHFLKAGGCKSLRSSINISGGIGKFHRTFQNHSHYLHGICFMQSQGSLENKVRNQDWESMLEIVSLCGLLLFPYCWYVMHIAPAVGLFGLYSVLGLLFFHSFLLLQWYFHTSGASEWGSKLKVRVRMMPTVTLWVSLVPSSPALNPLVRGCGFSKDQPRLLQLPAAPMPRQARL